MITLIIKNIRSAGSQMLKIMVGYLIIGGLFIRQFYDWELYMMYGYITMSWIGSSIYFNDKKNTGEIFSLSLPVTRSNIVNSRYLTSLFIIVTGFITWYLGAYIWDLIFDDGKHLFFEITYIKVYFMATLFVTIHQSVALPFTFKLRPLPLGISFVFATIMPIIIIASIFAPYKNSYNPYFVESDLGWIILFSAAIILLPIISIQLSHKIYINQDV
jgi:hypothetical protein